MRLPRLCAVLALVASPAVHADVTSEKLTSFEKEASALGTDIPTPRKITSAAGERRLVDAQVALALGDPDKAALVLLEIVGKHQAADQEAATYYLAEALYQKGDSGAARAYFDQVVSTGNAGGKYYQPSLQRLVEISIKSKDTDAAGYVSSLSGLSGANRGPGVPYVLGKYAFSQDKYDDAIAQFAQVPKGSDYEMQALYFTGASYVAKKDIGKAIEVYTDLISRTPHSVIDRRVLELGQLALGRLYYERQELAKAIDSYLLIDRHSDLFPDALYEVAWVYVKNKQYDKSLRALELLEIENPSTTKTPTLRILEGNLRIRKAQLIRQAQINGTIASGDPTDPAVEYDKAAKIFTETHDAYMPSYNALSLMVDGNLDPASFIAQIAGRQQHVFQVAAPIPEAAAQWLRDEPEVQRFVNIESDLGSIQSNLNDTEAMIVRLNAVIGAKDHSQLYPAIAIRRARIEAIQEDLAALRNDIHDKAGVASPERKAYASQYAALGNPERAFAERVAGIQAGYDKLDQQTNEISGAIDSSQAIAVALRKYTNDEASVTPDQKKNVADTLDASAKEALAIEDELADIHREIQLGKDL
ncbi:MAG: tetratricopeptide repeat protein, partial [Deltaproteobacteria bacterium]|nr:tetratricopeptide repeat protein [Deltaproteobacteria bacterium]